MTLTKIQNELKAPKSNYNSFGKYSYRSCEDILEAVKPLMQKHKSTLFIQDEIVLIGERYYVKATATFTDDEGHITYATAYAREADDKKGMDASQITGAASSYARKYALNGLFCIDDTKDADATNTHGKEVATEAKKPPSQATKKQKPTDSTPKAKEPVKTPKLTEEQRDDMISGIHMEYTLQKKNVKEITDHFKVEVLEDLTDEQLAKTHKKVVGS